MFAQASCVPSHIQGTWRYPCLFAAAASMLQGCRSFAWAQATLIVCIRRLCVPFCFWHAGSLRAGFLQSFLARCVVQNDAKILHVLAPLFFACCHHRNLCM